MKEMITERQKQLFIGSQQQISLKHEVGASLRRLDQLSVDSAQVWRCTAVK